MTRSVALAIGVAALAALMLAGLGWIGLPVLPSCLAGWLLVSAFPLGAVPLVLGAEALGLTGSILVAALRRLLWLMPLASVLSLPVLIGREGLEGGPLRSTAAWARSWMASDIVIGRTVVFCLVWIVLAWVFARPRTDGRPRGGIALAGLLAHLVMVTIAATDWIEVVEPGLNSSVLGLILMTAQMGLAVSAASLMVMRERSIDLRRVGGVLLATLSGVWLFLHFVQYLVVWSANLPEEIPWYLQRDAGLGGLAEAVALLACVVAIGAALLDARGRVWGGIAALLLAVHGAEMFWLVVPASRGSFMLTIADGAAIAIVAGLVLALAGMDRSERHGARLSHAA